MTDRRDFFNGALFALGLSTGFVWIATGVAAIVQTERGKGHEDATPTFAIAVIMLAVTCVAGLWALVTQE